VKEEPNPRPAAADTAKKANLVERFGARMITASTVWAFPVNLSTRRISGAKPTYRE
jgi:hypothetical protein